MTNIKKKEVDLSHATTIVKTIKALQVQHGVTDAEVSRATNISQGTLSRLLSGETVDPRVSTLVALASFFQVPISTLFGEEKQGLIPVINLNAHKSASSSEFLRHDHQVWIRPTDPSMALFAVFADENSQLGITRASALIVGGHREIGPGDLVVVENIITGAQLARIVSTSPLVARYRRGEETIERDSLDPSRIIGAVQEIVVLR
ncbi:helix-turn-helix domain-containing protein [Burkholderia glumae]|uniref:helix-turn-helix domain-containing protein n=1 Tax=Burkholderia glumae TaxID=337 RepID=UPI002036B116|nr:helix-turn-helix transcriptional regulator [Burkholderia glumae]MCM2496101.1 helix-turn-helix transcriptional regulator [Burkholderia glumae]UVT00154.1 XRE family transcriptional regulator [Burkholderia glumae]